MAVWGKVKIASTTTTSKAPLVRTPSKAGTLFSETLTAALGKRKSKFKDITDELNQHINNEEKEELYQRPLFNADKIRRMMERIVEKQFDVDEEEMRYVYNPAKNLKMCQNISKQIKDRLKAMNFKRHRIISIATIVEKQQQGIHYKMKYILDPKLDDYVRLYHETPHFYIIATVLLRASYTILGRGSYGIVIKASYRGNPIAVKILDKQSSHQHSTRYDSLLNEANALKLRHDNIVTVLKIVNDAQFGLVLMERFDGYCLQRILSLQRNQPIAVHHKLLLVHLDVKPQNVIVTINCGAVNGPGLMRNYLCKLCDFGSSMMLVPWQRNETLVNRGTIRYMAPELLRGQFRPNGRFTERADIYSYGVTMWQLDEERLPYEEITCNEIIAYNVVKKGLRPDSVTAGAFSRRVTNQQTPTPTGGRFDCLHGGLSAALSPAGVTGGRFESDAVVDDVLQRQGIAVEYRDRKKSPIGAICAEVEANDRELNVATLRDVFGEPYVIPHHKQTLLRQTMRTLYSQCWRTDPIGRPDAVTVRATIHEALKKIAL
uniref:non-specific serine/threonine protein kinase n=1 Tax=Anopheles farauti TaxID=69004 RepID=A0A182R153_9DIPT